MYDPDYPRQYKKLLKAWVTWIVANDIPLSDPGIGLVNFKFKDTQQSEGVLYISIPYSRWYFAMVSADYRQPPGNEIAAALRSKTEVDRQELIIWLKDLLYQIHDQVC